MSERHTLCESLRFQADLSGSRFMEVERATVWLLLDLVEAAQALDKTWKAHGFTHNHIPDALTLSEALEPLVKE